MGVAERWDRTARLFNRYEGRSASLHFVVVITRNTRLMRTGDIMAVSSPNGWDRWAVTGVSGKGLRLWNYYVLTDRCDASNPAGTIVELPGELQGRPATDPGVRAFVLGLCTQRHIRTR